MTEVGGMDEYNGRSLRLLLAAALLLFIIGGVIDLVLDAPKDWLSAHVIFELAMIAAALAITIGLGRGWLRAERSLAVAQRTLEERKAERDAWRASAEAALAGLGDAVDKQFHVWGLTPAEREVALLLLKGRSHKAIAYATGRSERTVRQHAVTVYQKSKLGGRAELAAFFLEDLMLPDMARAVAHADRESVRGAS
jgi:DNA-binding CsgD family transcriptional regulator